MTLVVDINHWLDKHGELPFDNPRLYRKALRIVRFIEYGGPIAQLDGLMTLVECRKKPKGKSCRGLMWVVKRGDDRIEAHCPVCNELEVLIAGWQETMWASGVPPAIPMTDD